ncbi:MAG: biotin/lipoyl-binding protein [Deltaproteobacteria bacterium]|jgi:multidrug resistance efflux pump|nr:biotin/lipoyl-binding protein [Deltaproteobacteria bacterium]
MVAALLITAIAGIITWLVFFKFKWIQFTYGWGFFLSFFVAHLALVFLIGLRFVAPYTTDARVVQHTIQLVPRLPEPTLVTAVLVAPNVPIKKGQPLFQFDRRPYEYKVRQLEAALAAAQQNVLVLKAEQDAAAASVVKAKAELRYAEAEFQRQELLVPQRASSVEDLQKAEARRQASQAAVAAAQAAYNRARIKYDSQIDGENPTVAEINAELAQARYYLDNTTMTAPEDGTIINIQVRPGMVAGIVRFGAIASFIVDADRYLLGSFFQEHLKYVKDGQPVEVAMDLYPGQIFKASVDSIWWASGEGQLLPSGSLPAFEPTPKDAPQGQFAVKIRFDAEHEKRFPIGAQGAATIYTGGGGFAMMRRIVIRTYSWMNWLYPMPF